jgi:hypothetical protein
VNFKIRLNNRVSNAFAFIFFSLMLEVLGIMRKSYKPEAINNRILFWLNINHVPVPKTCFISVLLSIIAEKSSNVIFCVIHL